MTQRTAIEWVKNADGSQGHSANPIRFRLKSSGKVVHFCIKHSSGCAHCYSESLGRRWGSPEFIARNLDKVEPFLDEKVLEAIERRQKPTTWFLCDMTDWMAEWVPDSFIDRIVATVGRCQRHTFQLLTKRAERLPVYFNHDYVRGRINDDATKRGHPVWSQVGPHVTGPMWPLRNLWIGISCENQATADERIPHLLKTPAAARFLSCEPLLGPIDLAGWDDASLSADAATETWDEFQWPTWVPQEQRRQIERFWSLDYSRGPAAWLRDHAIQHVPATGSHVTCEVSRSGWAMVDKMATSGVSGRYLHSWNNIGRIITDEGKVIPASGGHGSGWLSRWLTGTGDYEHKLHWVIVGGESGKDARVCRPEWIRQIVRDCVASGVACFVKQLGANIVTRNDMVEDAFNGKEGWPDPEVEYNIHGFREDYQGADCRIRLRDKKGGDPSEWPEDLRVRQMPKLSGRLLDGRVHDELPEVRG